MHFQHLGTDNIMCFIDNQTELPLISQADGQYMINEKMILYIKCREEVNIYV